MSGPSQQVMWTLTNAFLNSPMYECTIQSTSELSENADSVPPGSLRFPRFRPPKLPVDAAGRMAKMPHIRLDRALEFLLGDRFA